MERSLESLPYGAVVKLKGKHLESAWYIVRTQYTVATGISQTPQNVPTHTHTHRQTPIPMFTPPPKPQTSIPRQGPGVFAHRNTDTHSTPFPPRKTATPATTTVKASFTAQGVMGTASPAGWWGRGLGVGRCLLCSGSHSAPGRERVHSPNTPLSVP